MASAAENTVVRGIVKSVADEFAVIDLGDQISGRVPVTEFGKPPQVAPGDAVEVLVEVLDEGKEAVLSKEKADQLRKWDVVAAAHAKGELVEGTVVAPIKGGYSVDIGLRAFLPGKHADLKSVRDNDELVGQTLQFKILKLDASEASVVLSRRVLLEEERKAVLEKLAEGAQLTGKVKTITDYGAFVDLGGVDGLVHVSDLSWRRVAHPREVVKPGDEVRVQVLKLDPSKERISLGMKQTQPDPWSEAPAKLAPGTRVEGKVVSLTDYGAFVQVADGIEGLVHVSELSWTKRVAHPNKLLKVGDKVEAAVLEVDAEARRLRLSVRQLEPNPWATLEEQYPIGSVVRGQVRSVTDFGVFVGLQEGIDGLVHVSDLSWTQRIKRPGDLYKKGDEVEAVVLSIDAPNERFALGIKQLKPDPWTELLTTHPVGSVLTGKVVRIVDFGAFVEIEPGVEGLVHVSQLREERVENPRDVVKEGDELTVKVIDLDPDAKKVSLSVKAAQHEEFDYREHMRALESEGRASFGDVLAGKLGRKE